MSDTPRKRPPRTSRPRRREVSSAKLDEVFGDVLPDTTSDERAEGSGERRERDDSWYLENRPPHH